MSPFSACLPPHLPFGSGIFAAPFGASSLPRSGSAAGRPLLPGLAPVAGTLMHASASGTLLVHWVIDRVIGAAA